jgi:ribonuclease HI
VITPSVTWEDEKWKGKNVKFWHFYINHEEGMISFCERDINEVPLDAGQKGYRYAIGLIKI